ncbi:MAG TPA: tetratricopeptide repeat protein, partial [Planctomycetota bacterium]|nr:tetratricopeptide repeat protein [Planctomycetota bacterium]
RVKVLSPRALLERLERRLPALAAGSRDAPERQRTLRATIEWSSELLSADEQRLFRRLSAFRGGWTLEAAEAICDADLDTLHSLVEKSLVRHREDRYSMLETIREHAAELLESSGEAPEVRRRHAEHFLALGERHAPTLLSAHPEPALDVLEPEHDNVRAALDAFEAAGDVERAMRLAGSVFELWCLRSRVPEGYGRLERLLLRDERATPARARALLGAAHLDLGIGAQVRSRWAEEAMELNATLGDEWGIALAEHVLAGSMCEQGDFASARPLLERCVARFEALGDEHRALMAMRTLAWALGALGEEARQLRLYELILERARVHGDRLMEQRTLSTLGRMAAHSGRLGEVRLEIRHK